ncbi:hypothetical protein QBC38DRAFT_219228 [Podospora fimiseda]|uniref:Bet v1-like protein n=1 Tax=Podospora fimiseda TaxID=252190 RepID=A0AAN7GXR0_9PEZI|nr:hypothetical protein QBC38DRAFT_219228 [Podospora fimiseda]
MAPATTNEVRESVVIRAPLSHVWHFIKLAEFDKFWPAIKKAEHVKGVSADTDVVRWTFQDGNVVEVKQDEHSNLEHYITYSLITSTPELSYSSMVSTIRCWPVSSGEFESSTFVQWTSKFSSDAEASVVEDAKYKRREALEGLSVTAAKMVKEHQK